MSFEKIVKSATLGLALIVVLPELGLAQNAQKAPRDTVSRWQGMSIRTNLLWDALAEPNIGLEFPIGDHWSLGANAGIKAWPRWLAWDWDTENPTHWRNFAIVPEARYYFDQVYDGWFVGADAVYTHFNVGAMKFPFGMYPEANQYRLQGDYAGLGLFGGYSWWIGKHWRIEAEAGAALGYRRADKYECDHCGQLVGESKGLAVVPKLGVNIAYNVRKRTEELIVEILPPMPDTILPPPIIIPEPEPLEIHPPVVEEWKGVAGEFAPRHPVLQPSYQYKPITPDRILRKEEGALYVFFELDKSDLKRSFSEPGRSRDNGPVLDEIIEITDGILKDTTSSVSCIQIVGLASIEGPQSRNKRLADNRAKALQSYIQDRLPVPDAIFETVGLGEAWTEFRDEVNDMALAGGGAGLSVEQLQKVLDIIDNEPDPDRRERKIKALEGGDIYSHLRDNVLGDQRNSGYIRVYFNYVPDKKALDVNRAIDALEANDPEEALRQLEALKDEPRSRAARASALFRLGRTEEALELLREASADGDPDARALLRQWEEHERATRDYEKYLQELNEYNNYINNQKQ